MYSMMSNPYRVLSLHDAPTQGFALGWYVPPLRGEDFATVLLSPVWGLSGKMLGCYHQRRSRREAVITLEKSRENSSGVTIRTVAKMRNALK
jgi:hypothetical protein